MSSLFKVISTLENIQPPWLFRHFVVFLPFETVKQVEITTLKYIWQIMIKSFKINCRNLIYRFRVIFFYCLTAWNGHNISVIRWLLHQVLTFLPCIIHILIFQDASRTDISSLGFLHTHKCSKTFTLSCISLLAFCLNGFRPGLSAETQSAAALCWRSANTDKNNLTQTCAVSHLRQN